MVRVNKTQNANITLAEAFGGLYTLKLPTNDFGVKGIYTIIIKPIEIRTKIVDSGILSAYPDIKGILFDLSTIPTNFLPKFEMKIETAGPFCLMIIIIL